MSNAKAGIGSAVNDATRELGATLGVAVIGSVFASLYHDAFAPDSVRGVPEAAFGPARDSIGGALVAADRLVEAGAGPSAETLTLVATTGFYDGMQAGCLVAAAVCVAGAIFCFAVLPAQPQPTPGSDEPEDPAIEQTAEAVA